MVLGSERLIAGVLPWVDEIDDGNRAQSPVVISTFWNSLSSRPSAAHKTNVDRLLCTKQIMRLSEDHHR